MTRIIAGVARGRRLAVPPAGTRPTSDRVREALFSALTARLGAWAGARVLDLYAGTGALGLEAASRGAAHVLLVEKDRRAIEVLRANVAATGLTAAEVRAGDVGQVLRSGPTQPYDVVLADPPYAMTARELDDQLRVLAAGGWLADGTVVVVERDRRSVVRWPTGYEPAPLRRYGDTVLASALWYRRDADISEPTRTEPDPSRP